MIADESYSRVWELTFRPIKMLIRLNIFGYVINLRVLYSRAALFNLFPNCFRYKIHFQAPPNSSYSFAEYGKQNQNSESERETRNTNSTKQQILRTGNAHFATFIQQTITETRYEGDKTTEKSSQTRSAQRTQKGKKTKERTKKRNSNKIHAWRR